MKNYLCMIIFLLMYLSLPVNSLNIERFTREKIMEWRVSSPDLNSIENLWSIVKMKLYESGKQYNCKAERKFKFRREHEEIKKD